MAMGYKCLGTCIFHLRLCLYVPQNSARVAVMLATFEPRHR
jgi:hypothetical protein